MEFQNYRGQGSRRNWENPPAGRGQGVHSSRMNNPPESVTPESIPENYLDRAEELMRTHADSITTSKLRRLFSLVTEIYNRENLSSRAELSSESSADIGMARIRFAYECGRDSKVRQFVKDAHLMNYLKGIGSSRESFIRFAQYMEALVAYHKFFGGKEN